MKKILFIAFLFVSLIASAQDKVKFHNGNIGEGKIIEVNPQYVKFIYTGEDAVVMIGALAIENITFNNGRVQEISSKIEVKSPEDWEKVKIVYDKNEVFGMKSLGNIEKHSNGAWSFHVSTGHFMKKVQKKIQKEAAERGASIALVVNESTTANKGLFGTADSSLICELYTY